MSGTITSEFTIWCGGCSAWDQQSEPRRIDAIAGWRAAGWRRRRADGWLCPACNKQKLLDAIEEPRS